MAVTVHKDCYMFYTILSHDYNTFVCDGGNQYSRILFHLFVLFIEPANHTDF